MKVLVVGDANADLGAALAHFPHEGDDALVTSLSWGSGGSAANVAAALARVGGSVRLLARVGRDPAAQMALRAAQEAGVDLQSIQTDPTLATGLCFAAASPSGERTLFSYRGASAALALPEGPEAVLDGVGWLHVAGHALLEGQQRASVLALIEAASARSIPISLDLCLPLIRAHRESTLALMPRLKLLFSNELELAALIGIFNDQEHAINQVLAQGLAIAAVKLGPRGCLLASQTMRQHVPGFDVTAIDTTGCGDAFVAGFLRAYLSNAPMETCALFGNAMGALTATQLGATEAIPDLATLQAFLAEQGIVESFMNH